MIIIGIIVSILIFSFIVFIHELGHFSAARFFGVRVEEFGIGIPPRAKKLFTDKKGTLYSLNWLPIGGFVKLTGETPNNFLVYDENSQLYSNNKLQKALEKNTVVYNKDGEQIPEVICKEILEKLKENSASYNLCNKPAGQQAIVILAGVFMNFLLAGIIFSILFFIGIKPIGINTKIETDLNVKLIPTYSQAIEQGIIIKNPGIALFPVNDSLAQKAGLLEGDILLKVNGTSVNSIAGVQEIITNNKGSLLILEVQRGEEIMSLPITPSEEGKIGSYLGENVVINDNFVYQYGVLESIQVGFTETYNQALLTLKGLGGLLAKVFNPETPEQRQEAINQVSGPIGIVDFITSSITAGIMFIFIITAIISINLGVFNLLPIPALDGGRFIFITINGVLSKLFRRKIINQNFENFVHVGFFLFLIALSVLIAYNDIIKIISD